MIELRFSRKHRRLPQRRGVYNGTEPSVYLDLASFRSFVDDSPGFRAVVQRCSAISKLDKPLRDAIDALPDGLDDPWRRELVSWMKYWAERASTELGEESAFGIY